MEDQERAQVASEKEKQVYEGGFPQTTMANFEVQEYEAEANWGAGGN